MCYTIYDKNYSGKSVSRGITMKNDLLKSLKCITNKNYEDMPSIFYVRIDESFYIVDKNMGDHVAKEVISLLSCGKVPSYMMNVTLNTDTVYDDISNLGKERNIKFPYIEYYKEAVIDLCGKIKSKNEIYWHMINIIKRNHINTTEFLSLLINDVDDSVSYILRRNHDYSVDEYSEDLECDYFNYAKSMCVVIDSCVYNIDCLTTIDDATTIKKHIESGKPFTYICDLAWDVDTIVGDIRYFLKDNTNISNYLGCSRYYEVVDSGNYILTVDEIIKKLK